MLQLVVRFFPTKTKINGHCYGYKRKTSETDALVGENGTSSR